MTRRLQRKTPRNDYSHQKRYWQHEDQQNGNNQKTKMGRKQLYGCFKQLTSDISHEKTWTWLKMGNIKRETESLLIAAQNNALWTNHMKSRIDKTHQNSKFRLWGDRNKTIYHISECSKFAQKEYKTTRLGGIGDPLELCEKVKFDHTNKWYMLNLESVQENETHKLFWDFEIQADHLISTRWPKTCNYQQKKVNL